MEHVQAEQETIREYVEDIDKVAATLESGGESCEQRKEKFKELIDRFERNEDPIHQHMATLMISFLAGLFVGAGKFEEIKDNLDLERWFRLPKSHERRIHGRRHAGIRIVQDGPTLVLALDAHVAHPGPFTADDLLPYRTAREPPCQREALNPRKIYELHFPENTRTCGDWARRRGAVFRRRQVSGPAGQAENRRGKPPARWTVCLRPNGSSDWPESSEE